MKIEKKGKIYKVEEAKTAWILLLEMGKTCVEYRIFKSECADFESLEQYVLKNEIF